MSKLEQLRELLPSVEEIFPDFKRKTANEKAGPCPKCGGEDRFLIFTGKDRFLCRQCQWKGDRIDLAVYREATDLKGLFKKYGLDDYFEKRFDEAVKRRPAPEHQAYLEKRGIADALPYLEQHRLIGFEDGHLLFPMHHMDSIVGIQIVPLNGSKKRFIKGSDAKDGLLHLPGDGPTVITEAAIDAVSAILSHDCNVFCTFSSATIDKIRGLKGEIVFFFDNDHAGKSATEKAAAIHPAGKTVDWSISPNGSKDLNDLLLGGHQEIIQQMITTARPATNDEDAECYLELLTDADADSSDVYEFYIDKLVPKGEPMIIGGKGGSGKTSMALEFAARLLEADPDAVITYICAEGTYRDTKVRARQMGLTRYNRFFFLKRKGGSTAFKLSEKTDLDLVQKVLKQAKEKGLKIVFVVIDSIRGMQKGSLSDDIVGEVMMTVNSVICQELTATACYIHHSKKNTADITAMDALLGSVTIVNNVRHALFIRKLSNRTREIEICKSNLGFEDHFFKADLKPDGRIRLTDEGLREGDNDEDNSQLDKAEAVIIAMLAGGDWVPAYQIYERAEQENISSETVKRAKKLHRIEVKRIGKVWKWHLDTLDPLDPLEDNQPFTQGKQEGQQEGQRVGF